jgi:UrcA family protein
MISVTRRTAYFSRAAATAVACLLVGVAVNANAAEDSAAPASVRVSYQDLDLATEQGSLALYARLVAAAHQVCLVSDIRDLTATAAAHACEQQAIARAVHDVNSPRLVATFAARQHQG